MPHGIVVMGHGAQTNKLRIIPKEEFEAFWNTAYSCKEGPEMSWSNIARVGDPSTLALKPWAADLPCFITKNGREIKEEFPFSQKLIVFQNFT
jgi:hypothetical protein